MEQVSLPSSAMLAPDRRPSTGWYDWMRRCRSSASMLNGAPIFPGKACPAGSSVWMAASPAYAKPRIMLEFAMICSASG